jgi:HSP20 family molecular chaperone IbpA
MATESIRYLRPRVDILANGAQFIIRADLPGVAADALDVRVERGTLTFIGRRAGRTGFRRHFTIPKSTDVDAVTANLEHGVLQVTLPKNASARARTIPVAVG